MTEESPTPGQGEEKVESIRILWETEPPAVAADYAVAAARPFGQFALLLCAITPEDPVQNAAGKQEVKARVVSSVRMSASVFLSLIQVMTTVWNNAAARAQEKPQGEGEQKNG